MNFDYLKNIEELQNLYIAVSSDNQTDSAYLRCIKYGRCLESLVRYTYAKHFPKYKAASSELIKLLKDKTFKQFLGKTEYYNKLHFTYGLLAQYVQKAGRLPFGYPNGLLA